MKSKLGQEAHITYHTNTLFITYNNMKVNRKT